MPRFVVHEHHARHLHYDFRLELDGVLRSWAIPKGPSMDPSERRLAIEVEDHELSYIDFQGTIPEGEYGAGEVAIWDTGEYALVTGSHAGGVMEVSMHGAKLKGAFSLFRMKPRPGGKHLSGKEWLLVKKRTG